jgi:SPP1 gp7 family putative phage head morphogenesis protein
MKTKPPTKTRQVEQYYTRQLVRLAKNVGLIITDMPPEDMRQASALEHLLRRYAEALTPWAYKVAERMVGDIERKDLAAWKAHSEEMRAGVRRALLSEDGELTKALLNTQVTLIKSIPLDAAQRVHELTLKGLEEGTRGTDIFKEIMRSGEVSSSKARTIARTETSRTAATFAESRALRIGSEGYIWRTSEDGDVRKDHRELDGKIFTWDNPPIADKRNGARAHPGCIYNCRCWAEILIPD